MSQKLAENPTSATEIAAEMEERGSNVSSVSKLSRSSRASALRNVVPPEDDDIAAHTTEAAQEFSKLSWPKLSIVLITETIALGVLSLPSAFEGLGMVAGVILCVAFGFISIFAADFIGQVCVAYPNVRDYPEVCQLMAGKFGYWYCGVLFIIYQSLTVGSHSLTGQTALYVIVGEIDLCVLVWSAISTVVLFIMGLPKTFSDMSFLGFIDFVSIMVAIIITMVDTGINREAEPTWQSMAEGLDFTDALVDITTITFAFSFAASQPSFMSEMSVPRDYRKAIAALGVFETILYTVVGAVIYVFVGTSVAGDALENCTQLLGRIAFGTALPVIYISGAINTTAGARFIYKMIFDGTEHEFVSTKLGIISWVLLVLTMTVAGWAVAEVIPFFDDLLSVISALCSSAYTFWLPGAMWFLLLRPRYTNPSRFFTNPTAITPEAEREDQGDAALIEAGEGEKAPDTTSIYYYIPPDWTTPESGFGVLCRDAFAVLLLGIGWFLTVAGLYSAIESIIEEYDEGDVSGVFTCTGTHVYVDTN